MRSGCRSAIREDDSVKCDRRDKYREYQAAGVREYWVIDPREGQHRADFFCLDIPSATEAPERAQYRRFATEEDERVVSQVLPGFWLRPAWLWQVDTLNPLMILGEICGIPSEQMQRIRDSFIEGTGG
jgi:hypothetical protein